MCRCHPFFPRRNLSPSVYPRVLIGLALAQLTLAGYVYVRAGFTQASLILPLPVFIYWYGYRSFKR
ncbi:unnamed protein product [Ectocarpus sp. 8 AP-2014]